MQINADYSWVQTVARITYQIMPQARRVKNVIWHNMTAQTSKIFAFYSKIEHKSMETEER